SFSFGGFLPPKTGARRRELEKIRNSPQTQVFYEAPHRIRETLDDVSVVLGASRPIVIARELTKIHEEFLRGTAAEIVEMLDRREEVKGEIGLLIGPAMVKGEAQLGANSIQDRVNQLKREEGLDEKSALKRVAKERRISKSTAYRQLQAAKSACGARASVPKAPLPVREMEHDE